MRATAADRLMRDMAGALLARFAPVEAMPLRQFLRESWPIINPGDPLVAGWYFDAMAELLEEVRALRVLQAMFSIPPRMGKTFSVAVGFPAWWWTQDPTLRFLVGQSSGELAKKAAVACRDLITSGWYATRWGGRVRLSKSQAEKLNFDLGGGGGRDTMTPGGTTQGKGARCIILDDLIGVMDSFSDAMRDTAGTWATQSAVTRRNDPKRTPIVMIAQRTHVDDPSGRFLKLQETEGALQWEHLCLPMEYSRKSQCYVKSINFTDPRTVEGELLLPERYGPAEVLALKVSLGEYGTACQLQQDPVAVGGSLFKREWWRFWSSLPLRFDFIIASWDMAFKGTDDSDFVVGQVWGFIGADAYLLDQLRGRWNFPETKEQVVQLARRWPAALPILVEDKANGPAIIDELGHIVAGLTAEDVEGSKVARAAAVSPLVQAGNVYLPEPEHAPWVAEFIAETTAFPHGANDDQVDPMTQALRWHQRTRGSTDLFARAM